jgi:hypothetical protein
MSKQFTTPVLLTGTERQPVTLRRVTLEARPNGEVGYHERLVSADRSSMSDSLQRLHHRSTSG